jgi:hypothetical protein
MVDGPDRLTGIHLRGPRAHKYMAISTMKSNKGWHLQWFYIKNYDITLFPLFTTRTIVTALPVWSWGPVDKEKKRLTPFLGAIAYLKGHGFCGACIIGAYHSRRVMSLMVRALSLYGMASGVRLEGMALAQGLLRDSEIQQRIREALDEPDAIFPIEGHPVIRPDTGFIDLVSTSQTPRCVLLFS